jgi:hypothetical protein
MLLAARHAPQIAYVLESERNLVRVALMESKAPRPKRGNCTGLQTRSVYVSWSQFFQRDQTGHLQNWACFINLRGGSEAWFMLKRSWIIGQGLHCRLEGNELNYYYLASSWAQGNGCSVRSIKLGFEISFRGTAHSSKAMCVHLITRPLRASCCAAPLLLSFFFFIRRHVNG